MGCELWCRIWRAAACFSVRVCVYYSGGDLDNYRKTALRRVCNGPPLHTLALMAVVKHYLTADRTCGCRRLPTPQASACQIPLHIIAYTPRAAPGHPSSAHEGLAEVHQALPDRPVMSAPVVGSKSHTHQHQSAVTKAHVYPKTTAQYIGPEVA